MKTFEFDYPYSMEDYKNSLACWFSGTDEEGIYDKIKDDSNFICNLNEDGLLHSTYNENHYEPAAIFRHGSILNYCWLFDGKIKDCLHPFNICMGGSITDISYYSERIKTNQPIGIFYPIDEPSCEKYNTYFDHTGKRHKILNDNRYKHGTKYCIITTPEGYPICDEMEMDIFKFKFAD